MLTNLLVSTGAVSCCIRWWTSSGSATRDRCKFYRCSPKKRRKRLHSCTCGDSLTFTRSGKTTHQHVELVRWLSFWLARHLSSYLPSWISADNGEQSFISEPDEIHDRWSRGVPQHY